MKNQPHAIIMPTQTHSSTTLTTNKDSSSLELEVQQTNDVESIQEDPANVVVAAVDYAKRAQWLRAAVLGANDGLLSVTSLMMGVGAVRTDVKTMILSGIAGLVAGAFSMAIGEFVSVYSQRDIELAQLKRDYKSEENANTTTTTSSSDEVGEKEEEYEAGKRDLPSPTQAAMASGFAFALGALVPLLAAAFIKGYRARLGVVVAASSAALLGFGGLGACLGRAPVLKSSLRVLVGGWMTMGVTFGLTKLVGQTGV